METKCFVNGCLEPVTLLWSLNTNLTYSCKSHKVNDEHSLIKCENFQPRPKPTSPFALVFKLSLIFTFIAALLILLSFSKFLIFQNESLISIVKDIEGLKQQSDLNYKFYSEILTVKDLLENYEMDFENGKRRKVPQKNVEIYSHSLYSKKLSRNEAMMAIADQEMNLLSKVEMMVKNLGILYEDKESEVLTIVAVDEEEVIYGTMEGTISQVDLRNHNHQIVVHGKARVYKISVSRDLNTALVTGDTQVNVMSMASKKYLKSVTGHTHWILAATVSEDDKWFVTGSCDRSIKIWEHNIYKEVHQFHGHTGDIWTVILSRFNRYLVSAGEDKLIMLWDFQKREYLKSFTGHTAPIYTLQLTKDSETLFSGSADGTIRIWDLKSGSFLSKLDHPGMVRSISLIKNDKFLLSISGNTLKLWDLSQMSSIAQLNHTGNLLSLAVSADEKFVFTGDACSRVWVWELETQKLKMVFGGAKGMIKWVEISEDMQTLAIAELGLVRIWDMNKMMQVEVVVYKDQAEKWRDVLRVDNFMEFLG